MANRISSACAGSAPVPTRTNEKTARHASIGARQSWVSSAPAREKQLTTRQQREEIRLGAGRVEPRAAERPCTDSAQCFCIVGQLSLGSFFVFTIFSFFPYVFDFSIGFHFIFASTFFSRLYIATARARVDSFVGEMVFFFISLCFSSAGTSTLFFYNVVWLLFPNGAAALFEPECPLRLDSHAGVAGLQWRVLRVNGSP